MSTRFNFVRLAHNMLRTRLTVMQELTEVYKPGVMQHKDKVQDMLKGLAKRPTDSELARKIKIAKGYYTVEMAPPSASEKDKLISDIKLIMEFMKTGCYKHLTVKQAWLLLLVTVEVALWFFFGETLGKMHLVGYKV